MPYPADLLTAAAADRALCYDPQPFGLRSAREAVAADYARRGVAVDPAHIVLSASTSEAYSWLFKLLCNPGEAVLVPQPSYPLFEHLTRLEAVRAVPVPARVSRPVGDRSSTRWPPRRPMSARSCSCRRTTRPGRMCRAREAERLAAICRERGWAIVADEVFAEYALDVAGAGDRDCATTPDVLSFTLGGASKSLGLPQVKLAWTIVGGPASRA